MKPCGRAQGKGIFLISKLAQVLTYWEWCIEQNMYVQVQKLLVLFVGLMVFSVVLHTEHLRCSTYLDYYTLKINHTCVNGTDKHIFVRYVEYKIEDIYITYFLFVLMISSAISSIRLLHRKLKNIQHTFAITLKRAIDDRNSQHFIV